MLQILGLRDTIYIEQSSQSHNIGYLPIQRLDQSYQGIPSQISVGESLAKTRNIDSGIDTADALRAISWQQIANEPSGAGPVVDGKAITDDLKNIFSRSLPKPAIPTGRG